MAGRAEKMYGKGKKIQDADDKGGDAQKQEKPAEEAAEKTAGEESKSEPAPKDVEKSPGDSGMFTADEVHGKELKDMHSRQEKERRDMHTRHEGEHKSWAARAGKTAPEDKGKSGTEAKT